LNIYDIAQAAGVSTATVSRVLSGSDKVSPQTREKVQSIIDKNGFVPNAFAQGLGLGSIKLIGLLCTDVSDAFFAKAVSSIEQQLRQYDLAAVLCCTGEELSGKKQSLELLLSKKVDAIILIGSPMGAGNENSHLVEAAKQCPLIGLNLHLDIPGFYGVLSDQEQAMRENVAHLQKAGCNKIAYFYDGDSPANQAKLVGYRKAAKDFDERLLVQTKKDLDAAMEAADSLFDDCPFDGILASEDILAIGAYKAMAARGLSLPTIGFNNSVVARCATPSLTSMENMLDSLCTIAVTQLVDVLNGKNVPRKISIACHLVERETFRLT